MDLRPARDSDSDALIALITAVFGEYPGCVMDVDREEPELRAPATLFERCWVAEDEGAVVGCIALKTCADHVELKKLYVGQRARRQGLGRRLIELVEDAAREAGLPRIELWSDTRFTAAHAVYEKLGYEPSGQTRDLHDLSHTTEFHYSKVLS